MSTATTTASGSADRDLHRVLWLTLALFLSYLGVAISLPVTDHYGYAVVFLAGGLAASVGLATVVAIARKG